MSQFDLLTRGHGRAILKRVIHSRLHIDTFAAVLHSPLNGRPEMRLFKGLRGSREGLDAVLGEWLAEEPAKPAPKWIAAILQEATTPLKGIVEEMRRTGNR